MSVLYGAADMIGVSPPWRCSDCGGAVVPPGVSWWGDQVLVLHPACAQRLGTHLIMDSREATLAGAPEPHWRRRAAAVVRHRLTVEEAAVA